MPRIVFALTAIKDLERISEFLHQNNPLAAKQAGAAIVKAVNILATYPQAGRPDEDGDFRELVIDFGSSGYIAKYHYSPDLVVVVKIKHQKEVGYI